jgi:hypothetical protein
MCAAAQVLASEVQLDVDTSLIVAQHVHDSTRSEETLQLHARAEWQQGVWQVVADGRARANGAYDGSAPYSQAAQDAYQYSADWRELYLSRSVDAWTLRLGWQQVVWGRADNLRVLDQVNPLDYRDFVLPDLNDYRISVPMVQALGDVGQWSVEALLISAFKANRYPVAGSEFDLRLEQPLLDAGFAIRSADKCSPCWEAGLQATRNFAGTDVSLVYFATRDDDPVYRLREDGATLQREYHRQQQIGAGLAHNLAQGFVLRGEASWIPDFVYTHYDSTLSTHRHATLRYLLGLDYLWRDWMLALQAQDRHIDQWRAALELPKQDTVYTASLTGTTHNAHFEHRLAVSVLDDGHENLWQARSIWKPSDRFNLGVALDIFSGKPQGRFGQFDAQDRLRLECKFFL